MKSWKQVRARLPQPQPSLRRENGRGCALRTARTLLVALTLGALASPLLAVTAAAEKTHGIAMHGRPALPADYAQLPYVDTAAPKGGALRVGQLGSFDSLNPLNIIGVAANGVREYVYESLLARSQDEPFTLYGLIARQIEMPDDRRWIAFELEPDAKFSDGTPITAEDVYFSWQLLKERDSPITARTIAMSRQPRSKARSGSASTSRTTAIARRPSSSA